MNNSWTRKFSNSLSRAVGLSCLLHGAGLGLIIFWSAIDPLPHQAPPPLRVHPVILESPQILPALQEPKPVATEPAHPALSRSGAAQASMHPARNALDVKRLVPSALAAGNESRHRAQAVAPMPLAENRPALPTLPAGRVEGVSRHPVEMSVSPGIVASSDSARRPANPARMATTEPRRPHLAAITDHRVPERKLTKVRRPRTVTAASFNRSAISRQVEPVHSPASGRLAHEPMKIAASHFSAEAYPARTRPLYPGSETGSYRQALPLTPAAATGNATFPTGGAPRAVPQSGSTTASYSRKFTAGSPASIAMPGSIDDALERDADPSPADTASASLGLGRLAAEGVDGAYARTLQQHMSRFKHYPRIARRRGWQGQPVVRFSLDREGALLRVELETSSGHKILDQAALDTVKKSVPFPKIPEGMESSTLSFKLPVQFVLDEL